MPAQASATSPNNASAPPRPPSRARRLLRSRVARWGGLVLAVALAPFGQALAVRFVDPPFTGPLVLRGVQNIVTSEAETAAEMQWVGLSDVAPDFVRGVIGFEDHRFFSHHGFDWDAIEAARERASRTGKPPHGASTISQQCARSLFLWQARSWFRKGLEAYYTVAMEAMLPKRRILELYVNVIELGDGIYGVEAAAQHYYHVPARRLTRAQAAMLVSILPNPREWNPLHPNARVQRRQRAMMHVLEQGVPLRVRLTRDGD